MYGCICVYMHIQTHARTQIRGESAPLQMLIVLRCVVRVLPSIGWDYFGFLGMRCVGVLGPLDTFGFGIEYSCSSSWVSCNRGTRMHGISVQLKLKPCKTLNTVGEG